MATATAIGTAMTMAMAMATAMGNLHVRGLTLSSNLRPSLSSSLSRSPCS